MRQEATIKGIEATGMLWPEQEKHEKIKRKQKYSKNPCLGTYIFPKLAYTGSY